MKFITPTVLLLLGVATAHPAIPEAIQEDIAALPKELDTRKYNPDWQFAELKFERGLQKALVLLNISPARRDMLSKKVMYLAGELTEKLYVRCEARHDNWDWQQHHPTIEKCQCLTSKHSKIHVADHPVASSLPATPASEDIAVLPKKLDTREINSADHIPSAISFPHLRGPHMPISPDESMVLNESQRAFDRSLAAVNISAEDSARLAHDFRLLGMWMFHRGRHAFQDNTETISESA